MNETVQQLKTLRHPDTAARDTTLLSWSFPRLRCLDCCPTISQSDLFHFGGSDRLHYTVLHELPQDPFLARNSIPA